MNSFINVAHAGVITEAPRLSAVGLNVFYYLLSLAGIIAIIALVIAGTMYVTSFGDQKNMQAAKNYARYSILGIMGTFGSMILIKFIGSFFK